ncbi:unnamed protein product [Closterium sp. NIES-54]
MLHSTCCFFIVLNSVTAFSPPTCNRKDLKTLLLAPAPTLSISTLHLPSGTTATTSSSIPTSTPSSSPAAHRSLPLLAGPAGKGALLGLMHSGEGVGGGVAGKGGSGGERGEEGGAGGSGETDEERVRREVGRVDRARVETSVLLLGRIAESSDLVEDEVSCKQPFFSFCTLTASRLPFLPCHTIPYYNHAAGEDNGEQRPGGGRGELRAALLLSVCTFTAAPELPFMPCHTVPYRTIP